MTDEEFLDKVCDFTDRWSKPILTGICGYLLSAVIIAWNVTDWVVASARDNLGALIAFGVGGALTGAALASLFWRHVVKRALRAKDAAVAKRISSGLDGMSGFEHVDNLDALIEKARGLSALQRQLSARDAEIASLEAELAGRPTREELNERDVTISSLERDLGARDHADAERAGLRETFLHKIDFDQQAAVVSAWLSPGRRLDVSARPVRGLGGGFSLDELLVPDGDGWARATDGAVSLLDSSGDLVALVMDRELESGGRAARDDLPRTLREMDFYTKSALVALWEHGAADVTWIDPDDPHPYDDMFDREDENFLRLTNGWLRDLESLGLVRHETVSGWGRRWTLEDGVADLLAAHEDALAAAREDAGLTWERLTEIPGQGCPPSGGAVAKEDLDSLELRFRTMSFGAKMLCAGIWQNGGIEREPGPTMPAEEEVEEASGAGFVLAEPTSEFGRVRFLATGDLTTLFTERPEEYERVRSDFARGRYQIRDGRLVRVG